MARRSRTGVRGLRRDPDGRFHIDLRWRDAKTGKPMRHQEHLPPGITAAAAKRRATEITASAFGGTFVREKDRAPRLSKAFDIYMDWVRTNRPHSLRDRRGHADVIIEIVGDVRLDQLTALHVQKIKRVRVEAELAAATVNRTLATLKHMVGLAASEWHWIELAHAMELRSVKKLREPPGRVRYLSADEETALFETLDATLRPMVATAMLTGMRLGELCGLRKRDVDLPARYITLTKTKSNRVRRVPIADALRPIIEDAMRASPDAYVFPWRRVDTASRAFSLAKTEAGLEDFRFHDLRHHFATMVRKHGAGIDTIAKLLGHASLQMATRYAHLGDDAMRDAVSPLEGPGIAFPLPSVVSLALRRRRVSP